MRDIDKIVEACEAAFYAALADAVYAETGDIDPAIDAQFNSAARAAVEDWLAKNAPTRVFHRLMTRWTNAAGTATIKGTFIRTTEGGFKLVRWDEKPPGDYSWFMRGGEFYCYHPNGDILECAEEQKYA